jgi:prophage regulatory protein
MKILRRAEIVDRSGLSFPTIWRKIQAGTFPKPVQLGPNSVGWVEEEFEAWAKSLPRGHIKLGSPQQEVA